MASVKVFDPVLRLLHGALALCIFGLISTALLAEVVGRFLIGWHVLIGFALVLVLALRLLWGFFGPKYARWSDFWHPRVWWAAVRHGQFRSPRRLGHDALASAAYLVVYALLFTQAGLGLAMVIEHRQQQHEHATAAQVAHEHQEHAAAAEHEHQAAEHASQKPVASDEEESPVLEAHEAIFALIAAFVLLHLSMLVVHYKLEGRRLVRSMVTGEQDDSELQ